MRQVGKPVEGPRGVPSGGVGGSGVFSNADKDKLDIQGTTTTTSILRGGGKAGIYTNKLNGKIWRQRCF